MGIYPEILYNWFIMQSDEKREFLSSCAVCCVFSVRSVCYRKSMSVTILLLYTVQLIIFFVGIKFFHVVVCKKFTKNLYG